MRIRKKTQDPVWRKSKRGFRGYPVLTVGYYGPDDTRATKVAVGLVREENGDAEVLERMFTTGSDARYDLSIRKRVAAHMEEQSAASVAMTHAILGCPHEEGIDYAEGTSCPECPAWDRVNPLASARAESLAEAFMRSLYLAEEGDEEADSDDRAGAEEDGDGGSPAA